jgi:hypothetical protein
MYRVLIDPASSKKRVFWMKQDQSGPYTSWSVQDWFPVLNFSIQNRVPIN